MRMTNVRSVVILSTVLALAAVTACAARGARNQLRVAAVAVGDTVIDLSRAESRIYASSLYDKATHDRLDDGITALLYAARGFERAAAAWQEGDITPETVAAARAGVLAALADVERAIPPGAVQDAFAAAVRAVRAALAALPSTTGRLESGSPRTAQTVPPVGGVMGVFALINLIAGLIASGRTTFERILAALRAEGATDEELAAVDGRLTDELLRRERARAESGG